MRVLAVIVLFLALAAAGIWAAFAPVVQKQTADSVDPPTGRLVLAGLSAPVSVRRDAYGVPLVEAATDDDLAFATGYVMAQDRLNQMVGMTLSAQGRLSEMAGPSTFGLDVYMRTLGIRRTAEAHYRQVPPELQHQFERFADGVNAYVDSHRDRLPLALRLGGYVPEKWTPMNSMDIYVLLNLGLALNLHQELAFLNVANKVGPERAAWLFPTMPDEPLPFAEARKLAGRDLAALSTEVSSLAAVQADVRERLMPLGLAASNNWVIAPQRTAKGASILANDTHLLLQHPPMWMLMQMRSPSYNATGIAIAGIPGIVAGYNGHVAWGMTMVMADGQDLYVEKLRRQNGVDEYRSGDTWRPVTTREETFRIRGRDTPAKLTVRSTPHGPLLNDALRATPVNPLQPEPTPVPADFGLALAWTVTEPDASLAALWQVARATTIKEAQDAVREIRYIHLNLVFADKDNIGWQVTGRYPVRGRGTGKFPSPGWDPSFDWQGWADVAYLPAAVNPPRGFVGTANDRKVPAESPLVLSSSWYYPERGERIDELLAARTDHTADTSVAMQADQVNLFARKFKRVLLTEPLAGELRKAIGRLPSEDSARAMEAYASLTRWDGDMRASSVDALVFGLFQDAVPRVAFLDELGGDEAAAAWRGLVNDSELAYSATQDHLLQRAESPYWDDVTTPQVKEAKADILARAMAAAITAAETRLGKDRAQWQWGKVHTYTWRSPATEMRDHLPWLDRLFLDRLSPYLDRGPFPAGGDHNTLNVSGSRVGSGRFDVEVVPAMRMVVDFSQPEPVQLVIAGGQSDDPASPHYADGIALYLSGKNRPMPFNDEKARHAHFDREFILAPAAAGH